MMTTTTLRKLLFTLSAGVALLAFSGCAKDEHREIRVHEEQHEGEVHEAEQGQEMIVE